jgi:hypothetical protein
MTRTPCLVELFINRFLDRSRLLEEEEGDDQGRSELCLMTTLP